MIDNLADYKVYTFSLNWDIINGRKEENREVRFMCSSDQLDILLQQIAQVYRQVYGEEIVKILMYGSYGRGTFDDESDIDSVAIGKGERESLQQGLKLVWERSAELELEYEIILSPTVIPYDEFERFRDDLPYYRNIEREGVEIVA